MSEETNDFRSAMNDVVPLRHKRVVQPGQRPPELTEQQEKARENALGVKPPEPPQSMTLGEVPLVGPRDFLEWKKEGVQNLVVDRLRKGYYEAKRSLDLHGYRIKAARQLVHDFLQGAHQRDVRCVLIAHGRGEKSDTPAKMKSYVAAWLENHELVNAFVSADRRHGGTGAVFVLLKKSPAASEENRQAHGSKGEPEV